MTFAKRLLMTMRLLAISPVATVLWFGTLGGMVWRLEADLYGRDGYGSQVGNWIHLSTRLTYLRSCFVDFNAPISGCTDSQGRKHIMCEGVADLGIARLEWTPPLNEHIDRYRNGSLIVFLGEVRDRGVLAHTERVWNVSAFDNSSSNSRLVAPEYLQIMEDNGLRQVAHVLQRATERTASDALTITRGEITRPIWSGYIYNSAMVLLLVAGVYSMQWVWRGAPLRQLRQVWKPDGSCVNCGYSLAGLNAVKCPECGKELKAPDAEPEAAAC